MAGWPSWSLLKGSLDVENYERKIKHRKVISLAQPVFVLSSIAGYSLSQPWIFGPALFLVFAYPLATGLAFQVAFDEGIISPSFQPQISYSNK
jgi:hypothetical protein